MKINEQGSLEEVIVGNTKVYLIFTRAGFYRGGKVYNKQKKCTLISGKVKITTFEDNRDIIEEYGIGEIITIGAGIPNLFYFLEDSEMIEWFEKDTTNEYFERYKEIKDTIKKI